jgi:hypothetical protein
VCTIVGAGTDTFLVSELSAPVEPMIAIRIAGADYEREPERDQELNIRLLGPDLDEIQEAIAPLDTVFQDAQREPGWPLTTIVPVAAEFLAAEAGMHSFEIAIDGVHRKSVPIRVLEAAA